MRNMPFVCRISNFAFARTPHFEMMKRVKQIDTQYFPFLSRNKRFVFFFQVRDLASLTWFVLFFPFPFLRCCVRRCFYFLRFSCYLQHACIVFHLRCDKFLCVFFAFSVTNHHHQHYFYTFHL